MDHQRALSLLRSLESGALTHALPLPNAGQTEPLWQGMGFQVGGVRLVAPLGEVIEVMRVPRITRVPGVHDWLLGIANVRGRLIPIADLHALLSMTPTRPVAQWRVLVVEDGERVAGLVVEQSLGMQYFAERTGEQPRRDLLGELGRYVSRTFRQDGRVYHEARIKAILRDERFLNAALAPHN